jgi:hypothetical protein
MILDAALSYNDDQTCQLLEQLNDDNFNKNLMIIPAECRRHVV